MKVPRRSFNPLWDTPPEPLLTMEGSKLRCVDGTRPVFTDWPDGPVRVITEEEYQRLLDGFLLSRFSAA